MTILYIFILLFSGLAFAQTSLGDINNFDNQELDQIRQELMSSSPITLDEEVLNLESDEIIMEKVIIPSENPIDDELEYFGYNYFKKDVSFFDNIPTPIDYRLGPGDQIIVSIWGETNSRKNITINKDGTIFYENIGFINLSNQTIDSAELILIEELSRIYSTLKDRNNPSQLMVSLGKLKSMNIYFSGNINNPGINLIHPFSDIFSAISQAGGININGSLREVQLIRNNKVISSIDFYDFFMNGKNNFSNVKLIDGDFIHIPNVRNRVSILGEVNRPSTYELLPNETVLDLIEFASGFTSEASTSLIIKKIIPAQDRISDDNAKTSLTVKFNNSNLITLNNGDNVEVLTIPPVDSEITIYGRIKLPGKYPSTNATLKNILDVAGGFDDPVFRQTIRENEIVVQRQNADSFYSDELIVKYKDSDKFKLLPNDKIFVYEDINYRNSFTYRVEGEVFKPGTYPLKKGLNLEQAIEIAGGLTELSTIDNIVVSQEFTEIDEFGVESTSLENLANVQQDFELSQNTVIKALPFENVIKVEGNVYNPGLVAYERGLTMTDAIIQAGGYKPNSLKSSSYVKRANGEIDKANIFRGRTKRLMPGDTVFVALDTDPKDFNLTVFLADLSSTLANIAAILLIVDNQNN